MLTVLLQFLTGTEDARLHADSFTNLLGKDDQSWGLSHKGLLWHGGRWTHFTKPFRENVATKIGILFDGIAGTLTYYKDDKCLGVAFKGLNLIREPLYPIVSSTAAKTEMLLTSMKREFVNLQDRCRAEIVKRLKCRGDVEKLYLPPKIRLYLVDGMEEPQEPLKVLCTNLTRPTDDFGGI